jgi:hypothetical protein
MTTRRAFLQAALAAPLVLSLRSPMPAALSPRIGPALALGERFYTVLCDRRFDRSVAFANALAKRGVPVTSFDGDITDFWYRDLSLLWRQRPVAIAGATTHGPLFCLERWAWDHGLRVTYRRALTDAPGDDALTAWIIASPRRSAPRLRLGAA